ncbi:MAG: DNA translocase FtsK 4TM domain-containing protein [Emcibacter sp.]|nr:DNA translocase FtsK 4TM domain-containing protein [Emcibacter sp.]
MTSRRKKITKKNKRTILPEAFYVFMVSGTTRLWGFSLITLSLLAFVAMAGYYSNDPSWRVAGQEEIRNWLGAPGAGVADFLIQSLGLAAAALVFPFATWGWRIMSLKGLPILWRNLLVWILGVLLAALFAAFLPLAQFWTDGWQIQNLKMGGIVGDRLFDFLVQILSDTGIGFYPIVYGTIALLLFLLTIPAFLGLDRKEWQAIGRGIIWCCAKVGQSITTSYAFLKGKIQRDADDIRAINVRPKKKPVRSDPVIQKIDEPKPLKTIPVIDHKPETASKSRREAKERQPMFDLGSGDEFVLPALSLLSNPKPLAAQDRLSKEALEQNARMLESVLDDFGIKGEIVKVRPGPVVTLYELEPAPGTKSTRVISLADDIARSMCADSARVAVVPGKNAIGIELPNSKREIVVLREQFSSAAYEDSKAILPMCMGKDIGGAPVVADLASMPHLLVAGTTGSGKSVAINVMILSLLYKMTPAQCRLIMVDPKMLELSIYDDIPHLLTPVVTDPQRAVVALKWAVREMEQRYKALSKLQVRNIAAYNARLTEAKEKGETIVHKVQTGFDHESGDPIYEEEEIDLTPLPMIVVIVDEMADLMLVAGKDIEALIQRLAQMARAAGIHLIMATQRPSVDVITGTIKANFPTRVSFQVTSKIDSRTILGEQGAEQLLGMGDMLFMAGGGRIKRVHGPFVSDGEVERVVAALKKQGKPDYLKEITEEPDEGFDSNFLQNSQMTPGAGKSTGDDLYDRAVAIVARDKKASTSYIQRQLSIGYNRAANIIEKMEKEGVVSHANHVGKREVLIEDHGGDYDY